MLRASRAAQSLPVALYRTTPRFCFQVARMALVYEYIVGWRGGISYRLSRGGRII